MATVKPIPDDYPRLSPYLTVDDAAAAIEFYTSVLGATERFRIDSPDGRIGHAELQLGDSVLMVSDAFPEMGIESPKAIGGTSVTLGVYVDDVDAVFRAAVDRGGTAVRPVADQFYGDRSGTFTDPFGHRWSVSTHIEDVSPDEMATRAAAAMEAT